MARKPKDPSGEIQTEKLVANVTPTLKKKFEILCEIKGQNVNTILNQFLLNAVNKYEGQIQQALTAKDTYTEKINQIRLQDNAEIDTEFIVASMDEATTTDNQK